MAWSRWASRITHSQVRPSHNSVVVTMSGEFFKPEGGRSAIYDGYEVKNPKPGYFLIYPYARMTPPREPTSPNMASINPVAHWNFKNVEAQIPMPVGSFYVGVADKSAEVQWHWVEVIM